MPQNEYVLEVSDKKYLKVSYSSIHIYGAIYKMKIGTKTGTLFLVYKNLLDL